jgi:hypothetical protein
VIGDGSPRTPLTETCERMRTSTRHVNRSQTDAEHRYVIGGELSGGRADPVGRNVWMVVAGTGEVVPGRSGLAVPVGRPCPMI